MIKRFSRNGKMTTFLLVAIFILLFLYSENETFAISEDSILIKSTREDISKDFLITVTSGAAIISKGDYTIVENDQKFQLSEDYSGTITISKDVNKVTIAGYSSDVRHDDTCITMEGGREQAIELTIENLNIKSPFFNKNVIDFSNAGEFDNKLFISGLNKIEGIYECVGIHVPNGTKLTIDKAEGLIDAEAQLIAIGSSSGAGIGGALAESGGNIIICGGIVTATSNYSGAGIGGGNGGDGGIITINGGTVTASGVIGAGIGGGWNSHGGIITINEGKVTALGSSGSGIGGGDNGGGGIITISGGTVTATGAEAGIGGDSVGTITVSGGTITAKADAVGIGGDGGIININGGTVTATGDTGIGSGGWGTSAKTITISGGIVDAEGDNGAGIGRGNADSKDFDCSIIISGNAEVTANSRVGAGIGGGGSGGGGVNITISGGTITATSGYNGAGIGGGSNGSGGTITISGGTVRATGDYYGAGIGGGYKGDAGTINIIGGTIIASGGDRGAGIGTGQEGTGVTINISGGIINAKGSTNFGAAIGGGDNGLSGTITIDGGTISAIGDSGPGIGFKGNDSNIYGSIININGGTITAESEGYSAGISCGSRYLGPIDTLTINDGIIEAKGGGAGAGIGGYSFQAGGTIIINGGTITTTGGDNAAGIGGGYNGAGGTIILNGGTITATGGNKAAGIGGGYYGEGGNVTVTGTPIIIASGDIEEYAENIGYGSYAGIDSGTLRDDLGNDLTYIKFSTSGLSDVKIKIEAYKDGNLITVDNGSQTNDQGIYGVIIQNNYYRIDYTLSKPGYKAITDLVSTYPNLMRKNIDINSELIIDNIPPLITDAYIENNVLYISMDDYELYGTIYLIPKVDTIYLSKGQLDSFDEILKLDIGWSHDAEIELSGLDYGYYQVYIADSAENVSIPYEVHYNRPKSTNRYTAIVTSGSDTIKLPSQLNSATNNVETEIRKTIFENISESMTISIPKIKGAPSYTLSFTKDGLSSAKGDIHISMDTELGTIVIPKNMIENIQMDKADKVKLTIKTIENSTLPVELQKQLKNKPVIQLSLVVDENQLAWNNPNAPVSISIPYTPTVEEMNDLEHITVWYINGDGNVVSVPNGRYNKDTGKVTFTTTHFGQFAVSYIIKTFDDLEGVTWAKKPIEVLTSKGVLKGVSEKEYAPQMSITRGDFLYYLVRTLGVEAWVDENFDDISSDTYYYQEIGIAKKLGITNGTGNNKFSPDANITRQDMMVLTSNALRVAKKLENQATIIELEKYTDKSLVSDYAVSSVAALVKDNLIVGNGDKINPLGNTTRAEAAVFLYRIYNKY